MRAPIPKNPGRLLWLSLAVTGCGTSSPKTIDVARAVCPPTDLFEHAVCTCEDLEQVGELHVKPGPAGVGSVGVNGSTDLVADADIVGQWIAWGGFHAVGVTIGDSLITPADVDIVGDATIAGDAQIGGDLVSVGTLTINGELQVGGSEDLVGENQIASRADYQGAPAAPPCGCDPSTFFDVETAVAAARQATNGEPSWDYLGDTELHLATGSYYVTSAAVVGDTRFIIDGNVSVFVDGSLASVGSAQWSLSPGASLDLFVSGDVASVGSLSAGDETDPAAFRLYVGGDDTTSVANVGDLSFFGSLYAPRATVAYVGDARIVGSIFAKTIVGAGSLTVEYGEPVSTPQSCQQPPGSGEIL
jgi:hypothetical protein